MYVCVCATSHATTGPGCPGWGATLRTVTAFFVLARPGGGEGRTAKPSAGPANWVLATPSSARGPLPLLHTRSSL